jgi:hypothetical protein
VLHSFTGGTDGGNPDSPLLQNSGTLPQGSSVDGSTATGGAGGNGIDFIIHRGAPGR